MLPYDEFPPGARVWVYQTDRAFTEHEVEEIRHKANVFLVSWSAHGASLVARLDVLYHQFLRVTVDESTAGASGCSIDKLVNFMRKLESEYGVRLLDGMAVAYRDGQSVRCCSRDEFQRRFLCGEVTESTTVFDNTVTTKEAFDRRWEVPIAESWHRSLLKT